MTHPIKISRVNVVITHLRDSQSYKEITSSNVHFIITCRHGCESLCLKQIPLLSYRDFYWCGNLFTTLSYFLTLCSFFVSKYVSSTLPVLLNKICPHVHLSEKNNSESWQSNKQTDYFVKGRSNSIFTLCPQWRSEACRKITFKCEYFHRYYRFPLSPSISIM